MEDYLEQEQTDKTGSKKKVSVELADLKKWFSDFIEKTVAARKESQRDRDFYDGIQWTEDEIEELNRRNQPVVVINRIAPKINYVLGTEIDTRVDPHAYPRTPAEHDASIAVTDALRYVCDSENFDKVRTEVAESLFIEGYAGVVVEPVKNDKSKQTDIKLTTIAWDEVFFDPHSKRHDFSDAKYIGIVKWWDCDDVLSDPVYGKKADIVTLSKTAPQGLTDVIDTFEDKPYWFDSDRNRIRIIEVYWKENNEYYVAHYCSGGYLVDPMPTGDVDDAGNPFCRVLLVSAFMARYHDLMRYGIVRNLISPQEEINKRRSKALHQTTMRQVAYERDSVPNIQEARIQLSKPDGAIEVNPGALTQGKFQVLPNNDQTQGHLALMTEAKGEIDQIGPDAAMIAADQRVMSGRMFLARQSAGNKELGRVFDNLRDWQIRVFKTIWFFIRKNWTYEKWLRIRDSEERDGYRFVAINRRMTRAERAKELIEKHNVPLESALRQLGLQDFDAAALLQRSQQLAGQVVQQEAAALQQQGQQVPPQLLQKRQEELFQNILAQDPIMQEEYIENQIAGIECDIRIDAVPDTTIIQHEQFEHLMKLAQGGAPIPPDMIIEASDIRNKKQILDKMREPNPQAQQQAQIQAQMLQIQMQKMMIEIEALKTKVAQTQVDTQVAAQSAPFDIEKTKSETQRNLAIAGKSIADIRAQTINPWQR
jgi:hypothetical protein